MLEGVLDDLVMLAIAVAIAAVVLVIILIGLYLWALRRGREVAAARMERAGEQEERDLISGP
jgi:cbb3-type cytochrome oxidase subunit 3